MLREQVAELEAEVARLKRDLAAANAKALPRAPAKTAAEALDAVGVPRGGRGKVTMGPREDSGRAPAFCGQFCTAIHKHVR